MKKTNKKATKAVKSTPVKTKFWVKVFDVDGKQLRNTSTFAVSGKKAIANIEYRYRNLKNVGEYRAYATPITIG